MASARQSASHSQGKQRRSITPRLVPLPFGEAGEKSAESQPTDPTGKEEHCGNVAHHSVGTTETSKAQDVEIEGEDLHEAEERAQVHWPIHLTLRTKGIKAQGTVIVPMMPKLCNMEIIMPRAHVVVKRVEAFVVTAELRK